MAINFAAANMAGYNNPQIEVFRAHANENAEVTQAPAKSEIYNSLNRGCIPFILLSLTVGAATQCFLFRLSASSVGDVTSLSFTNTYSFSAAEKPSTLCLIYGALDNSLPELV